MVTLDEMATLHELLTLGLVMLAIGVWSVGVKVPKHDSTDGTKFGRYLLYLRRGVGRSFGTWLILAGSLLVGVTGYLIFYASLH